MNKPRLRTFLLLLTLAALLSTGACRRLSTPQPPDSHLHSSTETPLPPSSQTEASPSPTRQPPPYSAPIPEIVASLHGLPIDQFFDESFKLILLQDPEWITAEGLADVLGVRNDRLTDISDAALRRNQDLYRAIYDLLLEYDRFSLTPQQQSSYDVYAWYLDDLLRQGEFMLHEYPINPVVVTGVQNLLLYTFTEYHPMQDREDARDYLTRLAQVDTKMEQLIAGLRLRQDEGILPPAILIDASLGDIRSIANSPAIRTPYYQTFEQKLAEIPSLSAAEQRALLAEAESAIESSVLPGYQALVKALEDLPVNSSPASGVWSHPDGAAYYQAALRHHTSTQMTPDQVHQLGLDELERIQAEMRQRFDLLSYPQDESLEQLYKRLGQDGGMIRGSQAPQEYAALIESAEQNLDGVFDQLPQANLKVEGYPGMVAFYASPALDGSRPGIFYAPFQVAEPRYKMPSVAYHEGIPGHHFQISLARELDLPLFRSVVSFNAYAEGWALYAERLAWEQGWYADDPYGDLGRLQMEAFRAARLVADTGLHARQWTYDQAVEFMLENTGLERPILQSEVVRYLAWPGQATSYAVGYARLLALRQVAIEGLGERFDLAQFHKAVLQGGSLPLSSLERAVDEYITLASLETVSDFPLYVMRYTGDYGFSEFVTSRTPPLASINTPSLPASLVYPGAFSGAKQPSPPVAPWACSGFTAQNAAGEVLFGRNFDWRVHPALLLFTHPPGGYASVSMVDISYLGYTQHQPDWADRRPLLDAPYLPFDGMNSAGLGVSMMAVSEADTGYDPKKATLGELEVIRLLLDNTANVDEALDLLGDYNIDFDSAVPLHYFLADSSGASAVVEFIDGEMRLVASPDPWQVSTNFLLSEERPQAAVSSCPRYNLAYSTLQGSAGVLSESDAMALLEDLSQGGDYPTIWSAVYNLTTGGIQLTVGREYGQVYEFALEGENP